MKKRQFYKSEVVERGLRGLPFAHIAKELKTGTVPRQLRDPGPIIIQTPPSLDGG